MNIGDNVKIINAYLAPLDYKSHYIILNKVKIKDLNYYFINLDVGHWYSEKSLKQVIKCPEYLYE